MKQTQRILIIIAILAVWIAPTQAHPLRAITDAALPMAITRPGLYDLQPSVLHDTDDPNPAGRFKMWWLGQDPNSPLGVPGDRIYYATSADGQNWTPPRIVLAPQLGASGRDAADDHLLGSPSVLKINGRYYMFYEAYGTYATVVNRFFSLARGDNWTTHGFPQETRDWIEEYGAHREVHGFAPRFRKAGTQPVYAGEITYTLPTGPKQNRFLRLIPVAPGAGVIPLNDGAPVFWLYSRPGPGRVPLYSFWSTVHWNTFTSTDPGAEGVPGAMPDWSITPEGQTHVLGYVAAGLDAPDLVGCLQNRLMLATSVDGVRWTRFEGSARGGAVIAPDDELASHLGYQGGFRCPNEIWDIHRSYGCGYPAALIRDGFVELYFTDDTADPGWLNRCGGLIQTRVRFPVAGIEDPNAYAEASRQRTVRDAAGFGTFFGEDIKWSPHFQRYFLTTFSPEGNPLLVWSDLNPNPEFPPTFPRDPARNHAIQPENIHAAPLAVGRVSGPSGLAGNGLGQTLDFVTGTDATAPYGAFHLFYESVPSRQVNTFAKEIGHSLIFVWDQMNTLPLVNAGEDVWITAAPPARGTLRGTVAGDAQVPIPSSPPTIRWEQRSGPATALIDDPTSLVSEVTLPAWGQYVFALTASDGRSSAADEVMLGLRDNAAPSAQAGPDQNANWNGAFAEVLLTGMTRDDGLPNPPGRLAMSWSKRVGSGNIVFANPDVAVTTARFSAPGEYVMRFTVGDGQYSDSDDIKVTVTLNDPPRVSAGAAPAVQGGNRITLNGVVSDDGFPAGRVTSIWTRVDGPSVNFDEPANPGTGATLSGAGRYLLRLTASDGEFTSADDVIIELNPIRPPVVNAGSDQSLRGQAQVALHGTVTDDGLPKSGRLSLQWTRVSGPALTFDSPGMLNGSVTLTVSGIYVLRLTASDGEKSAFDEMRIDYVANQAPKVQAGPDLLFTVQAGVIHEYPLNGSVSDDGLPAPTPTIQWSMVSGPGSVRFSNANSDRPSVWFSSVGTYVLKLNATDGAKSASDTVTVRLLPAVGVNVIEGTVTSYGGNRYQIAGGARVQAILDGVVVATTPADAVGKFRFAALGAGRYSIHATWRTYSGDLPNCALFLPERPLGIARGCNIGVR